MKRCDSQTYIKYVESFVEMNVFQKIKLIDIPITITVQVYLHVSTRYVSMF